MNVVPVTVGPVRGSGVPFLDSCASIVSKNISEFCIARFSFTTHVNIISEPIVWMEVIFCLWLVNET